MIVVDRAAVVDALTGCEGCAELRRRLAGEELHAPALLDSEFVSVMRGPTIAGHLTAGRAGEALGCELVTRDARLARSSGRTVPITAL